MRFQASGKFEEGTTGVDPVTGPENISTDHVFVLPDKPEKPTALYLALAGASTETVTLTLYFLLDETGVGADSSKYVDADHRWFQFATGIVVTNGTLQTVTADLPGGGVVYARMTAETITASQTRTLLAAWRY